MWIDLMLIIEVFAIVKLPKMLSAGGTLEVFENKILGPDVKLFLFFILLCCQRQDPTKTIACEDRRKKETQTAVPTVSMLCCFLAVTLRRNLGMFHFFGYQDTRVKL